MIDFHTHILPNMDDGSESVETSKQLLNILKSEGVKLVCLTSHFYPQRESFSEFIKRRNEAYKKLNYSDLDLRLGAEVRYYRGLSTCEELSSMCIEGTNIILIELPFNIDINDNVISELININSKGYKVLLAHIERYNLNEKVLVKLHKHGILIQVNTEFFEGFFNSRKALRLLKRGLIDCVGSDTHNLDKRKPNYEKTMNLIKKRLGEKFYKEFIDRTYRIIG